MRVRESRAASDTCGHCCPDTAVKLARACARRATERASVGLVPSARLASSFRVGSPKRSHHGPRGASSFGVARRNGSSTRHSAGSCGFGGSYFGGFMHPARKMVTVTIFRSFIFAR